jgi:hypothetical protein
MRRPKDKTLTDMVLRYNPRFRVVLEDTSYVIKDKEKDSFVGDDSGVYKWTNRKAAEEFLAVGLVLGKIGT